MKAVVYAVNEKKCHQDFTDAESEDAHIVDAESLDGSAFLSAM